MKLSLSYETCWSFNVLSVNYVLQWFAFVGYCIMDCELMHRHEYHKKWMPVFILCPLYKE